MSILQPVVTMTALQQDVTRNVSQPVVTISVSQSAATMSISQPAVAMNVSQLPVTMCVSSPAVIMSISQPTVTVNPPDLPPAAVVLRALCPSFHPCYFRPSFLLAEILHQLAPLPCPHPVFPLSS